jgi:acyl-CoA synthetase (AMP-forming)/AMP-acid ligase II
MFVAPELLSRVDDEVRARVRVVTLDDAYEALLDGMPETEPDVPVDDDAIRAIKFTSGTTGLPKGCVSTNRQFQRNIQNYLSYIPFGENEKALLLAPLTAGVGMFWLCDYAAAGVPTVMVESFNAGQTLDLIERHGITRLGAVPTILAALIREHSQRPRDISSLRLIDYTGAPASVPLILSARQVLRVELCQFFGASETGGMISVLTPPEHEVVLQQTDDGIMPCGRLIADVEVRLVDRDGNDLPMDRVGEMVVRTPTNMSGYWNQPEKTAEVLRDGWLYTGDLARFDRNGFLTIMGRTRDEIITGGMNVYAPEVEAIILKHPNVTETAVVGVPDPYWGQAIRAYVVPRDGALTVDDIKQHCEINLANFKRPASIVFVDGLPKTSSGKVRRGDLYAGSRNGAAE